MSEEAVSVGQIGLDLVINQKSFNTQMNGVLGLAKKVGSALASAFAVKKLVQFGAKCVELGSDLQEVQNVVDVTFPAMSKQVDAFAQSAITSYGLSEKMAKQFTGTFGSMAKAFGFSEKQAYDMSTTLTGLAGDVASFYNITQDEAYTKLKSVFTGETESLKDLGVVMSQTALDAYAMANGYGKTTSAMSEAEKAALRYAFVQDQLSAAAEDFTRTSDGWANQVRVLSLQFDSLKATVGQGLISALTPVIKVINTILSRLMTLANAFKSLMEGLFGKQDTSSASALAASAAAAEESAAGTADSTAATANNLKKASRYLAGFDTIQKLGGNDNSGSESGASSVSIPGINFGSSASEITGIDQAVQSLSDKFAPLKESFESLAKAAGRFGESITNRLGWAYSNVLKPFGEWAENSFLPAFFDLLASVIDSVDEAVSSMQGPFEEFYQEIIVPFTEAAGDFIVDSVNGLAKAFDWLGNVFKEHPEIGAAITGIALGLATLLLVSNLNPLVLGITAVVLSCGWLIENWDLVKQKADEVWGSVKAEMASLSEWVGGVFTKDWSEDFGFFGSILNTFLRTISDVFSGAKRTFSGLTEFVQGVFSGDWEQAWNGVKEIFGGVFDSLVGLAKTPINLIIDIINGMIRGVVDGVNSVIRAINSISFDMPSWLGGGHVGFDLKEFTAPQIPKLANGGYVEANTPRLAMIGDNRKYGEIVAPEDKMQAMVDEAVNRAMQADGNAEIVSILRQILEFLLSHNWNVNLNCKGSMESLVRMLYPYIEKEAKRRGMQLVK